MKMDAQVKEAVEFFKARKQYHRFLVEMAKNYRSRGIIGGSINLTELSEKERMILCKIDSKYISAKDAKVTVRKFIKTFDNTFIEGVDFHKLLGDYFAKPIVANKTIKEREEQTKDEYFAQIVNEHQNTPGGLWLKSALESKDYGYTLLIREYKQNSDGLREVLRNVISGVNSLNMNQDNHFRLAMFASMTTKDPHYFDTKNISGKLLLNALAYIAKINTPENSEMENELLFKFGIIKDEISNFTTCANIAGYDQLGEHLGLKEFNLRGEPLQLNIYNLSQIEYLTCTNKLLYIFENPTVFSEVLHNTADISPSLLCTSGQFKLASLLLIDKAVEKVDKIYYSGDFDPEGITIANRLKKRYGDKVVLWKYDVQTYKKILSKVDLSERRLTQLESTFTAEVQELVELMKAVKKSAYQELLVDEYISDIRDQLRNK